MNQLTIVAYPPGAYGSFICWIIDRFSKHRAMHQPSVTDNPLLPDGSSHAYASFCKIKGINDFLQGMKLARLDTKPWHTNIYAGWPGNAAEDINTNIDLVLDNMMPYDKLIYVNVTAAQEVMLCYLRNEATLDKARWYDMLGIENDSQLSHRLRFEIESTTLHPYKHDPRMLVLSLMDILFREDLWSMISQHLAWPMVDHQLFESVLQDMRKRQEVYFEPLAQARSDGTPMQKAIFNYIMEKQDGLY